MLIRRESFFRGRATRLRHRSSKGTTAMNAASDPISSRPLLSGPAAAVLVALAGAALVAIGLLLVGVREARVSLWMPAPPAVAQAS
jgi:hypothetical protein